MTNVVLLLQNAGAGAFCLLGVATAVRWARRKDPSMGFLVLAIVLLSFVFLIGRLVALAPQSMVAVSDVNLVAFVGSGYALLRFRGSLIPLSRPWHVAALAAILAAIGCYVGSQLAGQGPRSPVQVGAAIVLLLIWATLVTEPTVRFWLLARSLPAVQAWRLRSLSIGFALFVAVLVLAVISAFAAPSNQAVEVVLGLVVIAIAPLLYVSFSPPAWLRRQWRSAEEEGLRAFMEELMLSEDREQVARRALEWAMRLAGGHAAAMLDGEGYPVAVTGFGDAQLAELAGRLDGLATGVNRVELAGTDRTLLVLPVTGLADPRTLVVLSGPFTPGFGGDEASRVHQFMSAFATADDRRHLIDQLRASNARLQDANRHKSVFLASMSHELRTPLNAILGFSELLQDADNGQYPPATRRRFLEQIHSSGKHLLGLINDILDLSKIEAGQMELRPQLVSVPEVVAQVLSTIEPLAAQKKIAVEAPEVNAGSITADPAKVRQMLLNLVSNAVKFTPDGGRVTIRAVRLADSVELSVTDTGIGIAPKEQERVFEEFQQVDSGIGRMQPGTGLGLTLTRRFANLHGGDVRVSSAIGEGSVFTITLPLEVERAAATPVALPASLDGHDSRPLVLVVEDDPPAAELLLRQLERAGFQTDVARTGTEALAKARQRKPAAITLDILLPDLDGWEVLTRLKRDEATSDIPVVIVSVVDNPELGTALGALDYFVKPVPAKELMSRLSRFKFKHRGAGKATVLVVDDEAANRDWLKRLLEPAGFGVILATGGREAIRLARTRKPDLVLLDLMMPEVTGFDVVEALRETESTRSTPVMVLTAKTLTDEDIRQLNGHVSTILRRGSTGAADLLGLLRQVVVTESTVA